MRGEDKASSWGELPVEVFAWAVVHGPDPKIGSVHLSTLNDSGFGFDTIANLIEAFL